MRRTLVGSGLWLFALIAALPASAQTVQSLQVGGGWFFPRGFDSRVNGDVLVANLTNKGTLPGFSDALVFEVSDFIGGNLTGEWNVSFGHRVEVGAGFSWYQNTVHSVYRDFVNTDRSEIEQDLRLKIVPIMGVVRFLPFGRMGGVQPYFGGGLGVLNFHYSETGQFVDPVDNSIFEDRYVATGNAFGGAVLFGIKLPLGGDIYGLNAEYRHQFGSGNTGGAANGFLDEKIDLGGGQLNVLFQVRF